MAINIVSKAKTVDIEKAKAPETAKKKKGSPGYKKPSQPFVPMTPFGKLRPKAKHKRYQCSCEHCGISSYVTEMALVKAIERGLISQNMQIVAIPGKTEGTIYGMITPLMMLLRGKGFTVG